MLRRGTLLLATVAACGRFGFDAHGDGGHDGGDAGLIVDAPNSFGCGLRDLAVGGHGSCVVTGAGAMWCWGELNNPGNPSTPTAIPLAAPAIKLALGHSHLCALLETGKLRCFGVNDAGVLGNGSTMTSGTPTAPMGDESYLDVAAARRATCAITATGGLECWGEDDFGVLGNGAVDTSTHLTPSSAVFPGSPMFRRIFATNVSMCADAVDGRRFCWGGNLALDQGLAHSVPTEVSITSAVGLGLATACTLDAGDVRCLGDAAGGELGDGRIIATDYTPTTAILSGVVAIAGGRGHCAVGAAGELWCWGQNRSGELGTGDLGFHATPARVAIPPAARIALGYAHACAEAQDGVYCWGSNTEGELGRGDSGRVLSPTAIAGLPGGVVDVRVGTRGGNGCARLGSGQVWCWGAGFYGVTGDPTRRGSTTPIQIVLPFAATEIGVGNRHACARSAAAVACWGSSDAGALGVVTANAIEATPVTVSGLPANPLSSLAINGDLGACVLAGTQLYCWGEYTGASSSTPALVAGLPALASITPPGHMADAHQCALDTGGNAWCWGSNSYGELGHGTLGTYNATPAAVVGGRTYSQIAAIEGYNAMTCAIPTGGLAELDCWGYYNGILSLTPTVRALTAVPVKLEAGGLTLCALFADGTRDCVGRDAEGAFGDGGGLDATAFQHVTTVTATAMSLSGTNTCFVQGGTARCVGETRRGALGDTPASATPALVNVGCQ